MAEEVNKAKQRLFLLIFHGGLVCYLILHNAVMPFMRNLGSDKSYFAGFHYWFLPHLLLFVLFWRDDYESRSKSWIPDLFHYLVYLFFYRTILFFMFVKDQKMTTAEFSDLISLASNFIFFSVFYMKFKPLFRWKHFSLVALLLVMPTILVHQLALKVHPKANVRHSAKKIDVLNKTRGCHPFPFSLQWPIAVRKSMVEIIECGFKEKALVTSTQSLLLSNSLDQNIILRFEKLEKNSWRFYKIVKLKSSENKGQSISLPMGLYLLHSDTKDLGFLLLQVGDSMRKGLYEVTEKGIQHESSTL